MQTSPGDENLKVDLARTWDQFLNPLVAKYFSAKFHTRLNDSATSFTDAEGRCLDLGHVEPYVFVPQLLKLLKAEKDDSVEIEDLDKVSTCSFSPISESY